MFPCLADVVLAAVAAAVGLAVALYGAYVLLQPTRVRVRGTVLGSEDRFRRLDGATIVDSTPRREGTTRIRHHCGPATYVHDGASYVVPECNDACYTAAQYRPSVDRMAPVEYGVTTQTIWVPADGARHGARCKRSGNVCDVDVAYELGGRRATGTARLTAHTACADTFAAGAPLDLVLEEATGHLASPDEYTSREPRGWLALGAGLLVLAVAGARAVSALTTHGCAALQARQRAAAAGGGSFVGNVLLASVLLGGEGTGGQGVVDVT